MNVNFAVTRLNKEIEKSKKRIERLEKREAAIKKKWLKGYHRFIDASEEHAALKIHGTKKERRLERIIFEWRPKTIELTNTRDQARQEIGLEKERLAGLKVELAKLMTSYEAEVRATDQVVKQTFSLSFSVADALNARNTFLTQYVFPGLIGKDGNPRSQIMLDHSNGRERVVAMVNTITKIDPVLAAEAKEKIEEFFQRFHAVDMDEFSQTLYDLTRKLLVEKTKFSIGPDLYRFLALQLEEDMFPELREAQELLVRSLRSERSGSYIRLYRRASRAGKWERIKIGGR